MPVFEIQAYSVPLGEFRTAINFADLGAVFAVQAPITVQITDADGLIPVASPGETLLKLGEEDESALTSVEVRRIQATVSDIVQVTEVAVLERSGSAYVVLVPVETTEGFLFSKFLTESTSYSVGGVLSQRQLMLDPGTIAGAIFGSNDPEKLDGTAADDTIVSLSGNDTVAGLGGDDLIFGGFGNDVLQGGDGNDILEGEEGDDVLAGQGGDDLLSGGSGVDILNGGAGADTLNGGQGGDTLVVDDPGDVVIESRSWDGVDTVISYVDFRMGRKHIENLELRGDAILGAGNGLMNNIRGNNEDNILDGGKNVDTLVGGAGNDTYLVRSPGDLVIEAAGSGTLDTVRAFRAYELTQNVERLFLQTLRNAAGEGVAGINGIGNAAANLIVGNPFDNVIAGRAGDDTLKGQAGADTFVFDRAFSPINVDRIIDFNTNSENEGDTLLIRMTVLGPRTDLTAGQLDADRLALGTAAVTEDQRFIFDAATGAFSYDVDGSGLRESELIATLDGGATLSAADIFLQ